MVSLMNGLSAAGAGIAQFAGTAGLEQQKATLAQQGITLASQLAGEREHAGRVESGQIAQAAAEAGHGYAMEEGAQRGGFEVQAAQLRANAELGAASLSAAASKYSADVSSKAVYAQIAAAAPERQALIASQTETTLANHIQNENATALQSDRQALVDEEGKGTPDPAALSTLRNRISAREASAGYNASLVTAQTAIYHTDLENVQQLNTRIQAATAALNSPEMEEGSKAQQRALIQDLQTQLFGAQISLKHSSDMAHGAVAAATGAAPSAPPATGGNTPNPAQFYTPPGGKPNAPASSAPSAPAAAPAAAAPVAPSASGPSNTPPLALGPISASGVADARQQLGLMDQIDAGKKVAPMDDPLGYADMNPAQRSVARANLERAIADAPNSARGLIHR